MNGLGIDFKIDSLKSVFTEEKNKFSVVDSRGVHHEHNGIQW